VCYRSKPPAYNFVIYSNLPEWIEFEFMPRSQSYQFFWRVSSEKPGLGPDFLKG
jgi:hypothetical protein